MAIREVDAQEAHRLQSTEEHVYVDVRTEGEFADGHPVDSVNVPAFVANSFGQMGPNPEFIPVMKGLYGTDAKLLLGCRSGQRVWRRA